MIAWLPYAWVPCHVERVTEHLFSTGLLLGQVTQLPWEAESRQILRDLEDKTSQNNW